MRACCPVCDRLCKCYETTGAHPRDPRARARRVVPHRQPVCPLCKQLATFVTDEIPGVHNVLVTASGHYTCINRHHFDEPIDGSQCTGHKKTI